MNGPFCYTKAKNNEEYKKVVKRRMIKMLLLFLLGSLAFSLTFFTESIGIIQINNQMLDVYKGVGTGLMFISTLLFVKNRLILKNEEKLKKDRINNSDERIQEISHKAFRIASISLLVALYIVGLIGGLYNPVLVKVLLSLISAFLLVYLIAYRVYEKRM